MSEKPKLYTSLEELIRDIGVKFGDGQRPYSVKVGKDTKYLVSKSPGQAALVVCESEAVPQTEIYQTLADIYSETLKAKDAE